MSSLFITIMSAKNLRRLPFLLCIPFLAFFLLGVHPAALASEKDEPPLLPFLKYLSMGAKVTRLFNSHTSYEFGNPFPPNQAPLSRLEFPINSWWAGGELKASFPRFSIGAELLTSAAQDARGSMKDSDWSDDAAPYRQDIYSESRCRVGPSYMAKADIDLEVSDWLGLPQWLHLRPVTGVRWQKFNLVSHDGIQFAFYDGSAPQALPGDGIRFKQTYWNYFMGVRFNVDLLKDTVVSPLKLLFQFDWAYVTGSNEDNHLLRGGRRFTYENTTGNAWHASVGLKKGLTKNISMVFDFDYLSISTTGSHRLENDPMGINFRWSNGVKAWSEQSRVTMTLEYRF